MITDRIDLYLTSQCGLLAESTLTAYRERLDRFADYIGSQKVTPLACKGYVPHLLASGLSRRSALAFYSCVQTLHVWLHEAGVINANPVPKLRRFVVPQKERPRYSESEVQTLLDYFRGRDKRDWYYATLAGWETSLRLSDVITLRWCELDPIRQIVKREPIKTRRFGTVLEIPISLELLQAARDCPPYEEADPSSICQTLAQKYAFDRHKAVSCEFIYYAKKAGVGKSFHALRHGRVAQLLNKGVPVAVVRSISGHSLRQLQSYSHVGIEEKRAALA